MHSFNILALALLGAVEAGRPAFGIADVASTTTKAASSSAKSSSSIASSSSTTIKAAGRPGFNAPLPVTTISTTAPALVGRPGFNAPKVTTTSTPSTSSSATTTRSSSSTSTSSSKTTTSTPSSTSSTSSTSTTTSSTSSSTTSTSTTTSTTAKTSSSTSTSTSSSTSTTLSTTTVVPTTTSIPTPTSTLITKTTSTSSAAATCTSNYFQYGCLPLTNDAVFVSTMLAQHNSYRARHNAPAMTWSSSLAAAALANAQNNANNNLFVHTSNNPNGENIAYQYGWNNPEYLGFLWYDEEKLFDFQNGGFADSTGHFTQMVWKSSTQLGCAYVQASNKLSNNGYYYLSCEYGPPGNYYGEYRDQVATPNSQAYPTAPPQWL